jgi:hypothetical protein
VVGVTQRVLGTMTPQGVGYAPHQRQAQREHLGILGGFVTDRLAGGVAEDSLARIVPARNQPGDSQAHDRVIGGVDQRHQLADLQARLVSLELIGDRPSEHLLARSTRLASGSAEPAPTSPASDPRSLAADRKSRLRADMLTRSASRAPDISPTVHASANRLAHSASPRGPPQRSGLRVSARCFAP